MNYIRHLNAFFNQVKKDDRLNAIHVSLYMALFQYWNFNRFQNPFPVYRDNIMQLSCIGSKNTYHKCMKGLHQFGYIIFHSAPSKYMPVKITMIRLDVKTNGEGLKQLDLFSQAQTHSPLEGEQGAVHVPNMTDVSINNDTQQVSNVGQYIKQENISKNSVALTPTNHEIKSLNKNENAGLPHVSYLRLVPNLSDVEAYFKEQYKSIKEAQKFFYYNQSKKWMLTDKIPVYDWKALANKWMLNDNHANSSGIHSDLSKEIQYLYERFIEGEKINKLIAAEYADHLELPLTEAIFQNAWQRRINQLSGSNEAAEIKLWQAYMSGDTNNDLIIQDQPNFISLAKRLAVAKHFQKLKSKGITNVIATQSEVKGKQSYNKNNEL